ncbi:DUF3144 domain-containing protein [Kistimonas asteriae]|uniref:DUF3144 domain-containing protein n=1 Tax=Kistimonas asteriae TaxID=517724 RepID=UPI001BAD599B|nr:DUF3144 domain-containing protein [Kistimonas asteriae]
MDKGNSSDFDMKDFFEKQKAAAANNQFNQTKDLGTKKEFTPPGNMPAKDSASTDNKDSNGNDMPFEIDKETEAQILEIVNSFISLANKHAEGRKLPINIISDAFLYAAARYNAFLVASADQKSIATNQKEYVEAFMEQYKAMLKDHFEFYKKNPL